MQINRDFTIQKVGNAYVAVPVGATSITMHCMVHLNETGAFLWKQMVDEDCSEFDLVEALLSEYEVDRATAERDVHAIVEILKKNNILV